MMIIIEEVPDEMLAPIGTDDGRVTEATIGFGLRIAEDSGVGRVTETTVAGEMTLAIAGADEMTRRILDVTVSVPSRSLSRWTVQ